MENIYHHAVRDFKYMKAIFLALSLPKPKSDFLNVAEFIPYRRAVNMSIFNTLRTGDADLRF